jgi:hypothetical protein
VNGEALVGQDNVQDRSPYPIIQVAYRPELLLGDDFNVFLRPRGFALDETLFLEERLSLAWRVRDEFLSFDEPIRPYRHAAPQAEWTAVGLPWPNIAGLLTFEIYFKASSDSVQLVASGEVLAGNFARLRRDGWVYAWSPSCPIQRMPQRHERAKPLPDLKVFVERFPGIMENDAQLTFLNVALNSVAPPEYLVFRRFPYDFGAARLRSEIPHGPDEVTRFLLPISRPWWGSPISVSVGSMGGYASTTVDVQPRDAPAGIALPA